VKRSEATKRVEGLLARVVGGNGSYLPRVREVWIFGSYAHGALEVGDVDLAVEFDQTKEEAGIWFATLMAGGFDHLGAPGASFAGTSAHSRSTSTSSRICARRASSHNCSGGAATRSSKRTLSLRRWRQTQARSAPRGTPCTRFSLRSRG
jgi:hypothetical protein